MRPHRLLAVAAGIALASVSAAQAQTGDSEVEILRAKVAAQEEAIATQNAAIANLTARLSALEGGGAAAGKPEPSPAISSAPMAAKAPADRVAQAGAAASDEGDAVDLADLKPARADGLVTGSTAPPAWALAPPGPIDEPLRPVSDGHTAAFELLGGTGGGRASFTFSRSKDGGGEPDARATSVHNNTFTLAVSAPLAKNGDTSFATLDGLSSGTKIELAFTQFHGRILTQEEDSRNPLLIRARQRCLRENPPYKPGCTRLDEAFKRKFFTPDELRAYQASYARQTLQQSTAWSLRAAVGYDEFAYFPLPSLDKATDRKVSWNVGAGMTVFPFRRAAASLNLDFQHAFKARKSQTSCPVAPAGASTITCVTGPVLGPEREEKLILAPELRYHLPVSEFGLIRDLGFAPKVEFDLLSSQIAFDMPAVVAP